MGSVVLTAATSGGAVIPVIMDPVSNSRGIRYGFSVPLAVFAFGLLLPLYTKIIPPAREQVDSVFKGRAVTSSSERPSTPKRMGRSLRSVVKRNRRMSESPQTEHRDNPG